MNISEIIQLAAVPPFSDIYWQLYIEVHIFNAVLTMICRDKDACALFCR